jgi:hypothetical protein
MDATRSGLPKSTDHSWVARFSHQANVKLGGRVRRLRLSDSYRHRGSTLNVCYIRGSLTEPFAVTCFQTVLWAAPRRRMPGLLIQRSKVHRLTLRRFDLGFVAAKRDDPCKAWTSSVSRAGELGSARMVCAVVVEVAATTGSPKVLSTIAFT